MEKTSKSVLTIFILVGSAILLLGTLIGYIIENRSNTRISISPNIIVRDSTDVARLGSYTDREAAYLIQQSIENTIDKEFERTINYLNLTIAIFAIFLTITLVAFGFFTIRKMSEARELLEKILSAPDEVMNKYHTNQLDSLLPKLLSSNYREKSDAIQGIYLNTQLEEEKHFDILSNALDIEYRYTTSYTYLNVLNLFDTLSRLNYSKAITKGFEIFEEHHEDKTMEIIVPQLLESLEQNHKQRVLKLLSDKEDPKRVNNLIRNISHFESFNSEMIFYLMNKAPDNITLRILNSVIQKSKTTIDLKQLLIESDGDIILKNNFHQLINLLRQNNQLDKEVILYLIKEIDKKEKLIEYDLANYLRLILSLNLSQEDIMFLLSEFREHFNSSFNFSEIYNQLKSENQPNIHHLEKFSNN